jgi:hypothetical protein
VDSEPREAGGEDGAGAGAPAGGHVELGGGGGTGAGLGAGVELDGKPDDGVIPGRTGPDSGTRGGSEPGTAGVIACRRGPHDTSGSVPRRKAIVTILTHSLDGSRSTGTRATRSGTGKSSLGPLPTTFCMYVVQIGTATREPVSSFPRLRGRS